VDALKNDLTQCAAARNLDSLRTHAKKRQCHKCEQRPARSAGEGWFCNRPLQKKDADAICIKSAVIGITNIEIRQAGRHIHALTLNESESDTDNAPRRRRVYSHSESACGTIKSAWLDLRCGNNPGGRSGLARCKTCGFFHLIQHTVSQRGLSKRNEVEFDPISEWAALVSYNNRSFIHFNRYFIQRILKYISCFRPRLFS